MKQRSLYSFAIAAALLFVMLAALFCLSACGGGEKPDDPAQQRYTITFDANGGNCSVESSQTSAGGTLIALPVPENIGFAFDGWYESTSGGEAVGIDRVFTADVTLYARWTPQGDSYRDNTMTDVSFDVTEASFTCTMGTEEYSWRDTPDVVWQKSEPLSESVTYYYTGSSGFFSAQLYFNADGTVDSQASYPTSGLSAGVGTWTQEGDIVTFSVTDTRALAN